MPRFLRFEGQVRNRRLGKRDTSLLIKDIWQEKAAHDAEVNLLSRFLSGKKNGKKETRIELKKMIYVHFFQYHSSDYLRWFQH